MMGFYEKIIVALDFEDVHSAYQLVDEVGDKINWFKIGPVLFTRSGLDIVNFLHERRKNIFLDMKFHDIPNVVGSSIKQLAELGVKLATVHCMGGKKMLLEASQACRGYDLKILGVTVLTSHEKQDLEVLGWKDGSEKLVLKLLETALDARLSGVICSPHEIKKIKEKVHPNFLIVTPGIRLPSREIFKDDQVRVATAKEAIEWGADFIVIGRPITAAPNPREVVEKLFD